MNKKIIKYSLVFLSYFFYEVLVLVILNILKIDLSNADYLHKNIYFFLVDIIYMIFVIFIFRKDLKEDLKDFKKNGFDLIFKFLPIYILGLILMGVSNTILINITGMELSTNEENVRTLIKYYPIYMAFSSVIYAPIVEELIFRKSIKNIVDNKFAFILTSGIIFGLVHVISSGNESFNEFLMGIPYIIMGIDFAYIYSKSKNIFTTISIHSLHNLVLLIIQLIGG